MQVEYSSMRFTERENPAVRGLHKVTLWVTTCRPFDGLADLQSTLDQFFANVIGQPISLIV
ncbi:hypothetical protein [Marinagarivorans algicola]|uniref:hypothetical protein n=1 Tax=Marinagarivorans algicola TaxID=1513270 RepID=UPI0012E19A7F|nr:hypothetical protein [Marinagarivorans algicola]